MSVRYLVAEWNMAAQVSVDALFVREPLSVQSYELEVAIGLYKPH